MSKKKPISDKSLINACILRSKYVLYAQSALHSSKELKFFTNRLPSNAPLASLDNIDELNKELFVFIDGLKRDIANYLKPIFHEQDIVIDDKFWFSSQELMDGYIQLSTKNMRNFNIYDRVLLLSNVSYESIKYSAGTIVSMMRFTQMSNQVKGIIDGKTFTLHYAMRKMRKYGKEN